MMEWQKTTLENTDGSFKPSTEPPEREARDTNLAPSMKSLPPRLCRRLITTQSSPKPTAHFYNIRQVTKANFTDSLHHFNSHLSASDFVAVSLQTTGSYSAPWHKASPFDTPDTAYLKAKYAAEKYQIFQFAVCPFSVSDTKVVAYPYNFHLFPRDELNIGMPSYSFYCQTSNLMAMAQEGFDLNACIDDGISYLSRSQEAAAQIYLGNPILAGDDVKSTSAPSAADSNFIGRIKARLNVWLDAHKGSSENPDESMMKSLKKIILGNEEYNGRPSMRIDVSSERQAELIVEMLREFADDVLPLLIPAKDGETIAIRVVLMKSKEDEEILKREIQDLDKEQKKKVRGFREVIDLICSSLKPVVSHNSLNDLTFIHSKFLAPLPPSLDEFTSSLELSFSLVIDINHLMKEVGAEKKVTSIPVATSYLKNHFFAPTELEIPCQAIVNDGKIHGQSALRICQLFAKLCYVLKITPNNVEQQHKNLTTSLEAYANIFSPFSSCSEESVGGDVKVWSNNARKVSCEDLVFLWGFSNKMTAGKLKSMLQESHEVFSKEFNVRFVDKGCAMVVFWQSGLARTFLEVMNNVSQIHGPLREMVSDGMTAAGYDTYARACRLELWEAHLSDALDKALLHHDVSAETNSDPKSSASELMINLDDL